MNRARSSTAVVVAAILAICTVVGAQTTEDVDALRLLRAENKILRAQIAAMRKQIGRLENEIEAMKAGGTIVASMPAASTKPAAKYMYRGRPRTQRWFDMQYAYFRDKISAVDGNYYDVGEDRVGGVGTVWTDLPALGALRRPRGTGIGAVVGEPRSTPGRILQAISANEALVESSIWGTPERAICYVKGIEAARNVSDISFSRVLVYIGPHRYTTALGAPQSVPGYAVYKPLSRKQFAEALAGGFRLVRYKAIKRKVRVWRGGSTGNGFQGARSATPTTELKTTIVPVPVP